MAKKQKYYVVWKGREEGVYATWEEAKAQVMGFDGARYKGFDSQDEAEKAFAAGAPKYVPKQRVAAAEGKSDDMMEMTKNSIAVDAACSGNPGKMEYRGISLWDGKEIFHMQFPLGTNNIGEFLAIVHALALLKQKNAPGITIYSDSMIAIKWVRIKQCKTKLQSSPVTMELMELVKRAEAWLQNNTYSNPIVKWPTEQWGEVPADFGRK